jgi:hypothetical protein
MPDAFAPMVVVPNSIDLRDAAKWLSTQVPVAAKNKSTIVLFDGRETLFIGRRLSESTPSDHEKHARNAQRLALEVDVMNEPAAPERNETGGDDVGQH